MVSIHEKTGDESSRSTQTDKTGETLMTGLQEINKYLSAISMSLETLLMAQLPNYVQSDLSKAFDAEKEASRVLRCLSIFCHKQFN